MLSDPGLLGLRSLAGPHASLFAAADARGLPGALPLDPFDDDSSSGTAGSPHGSESGFRMAPNAAMSTRLSAASHAPAAPRPSAASGAGAGPGAAGAAVQAAPPAVSAAPLALTEQELDALVRCNSGARSASCFAYTPQRGWAWSLQLAHQKSRPSKVPDSQALPMGTELCMRHACGHECTGTELQCQV